MQKPLVLAALLVLLLAAVPASAAAGTIYVDDDGVCGGNAPCYTHPQDAVNAAAPGDRILVYPGHYSSRAVQCDGSPNCTPNDAWAPTLIVYKDGLNILAIDTNPANTVIEATHGYWSNPGAVAASTAGGVQPVFGSEPNAVSIIASNVRLAGFTIRRPSDPAAGGHSNVLIGGLYLGYGTQGEALGYGGNLVANNVLDGGAAQARGLSIWHSSNNTVLENRIVDPQQNAIQVYDGYTAQEVNLLSPSLGNRIAGNRIIDDPATTAENDTCVFVGAWTADPALLTNNAGTRVVANDCGGKGLAAAYSVGWKQFAANTNVGFVFTEYAYDVQFVGNTGPLAPAPAKRDPIIVGPPRR